jgi:hypothetical protein
MIGNFARNGSDEAISARKRDCFAEFILSVVEGLAMTRSDTADIFLLEGAWRCMNIPAKAGIQEFAQILDMNGPCSFAVSFLLSAASKR